MWYYITMKNMLHEARKFAWLFNLPDEILNSDNKLIAWYRVEIVRYGGKV